MKTFIFTYKYITSEEFTTSITAKNEKAARAQFATFYPFAKVISVA